MILSDNVSDDDNIYDGTGVDEYHAELTEGTDYCFHWKGQDEVG